jgi:zeta-carotene desaturase
MKSPAARHMGVPTIPLTDLYNRAGDYIRARGGEIRLRASLETFFPEPSQVRIRTSAAVENFDYLILALPFEGLDRVLPTTPEALPLRENLTHFEPCPITGIHLWFDRQISDLDHAVLLDRTIQWMFHKSRLLDKNREGRDSSTEPALSKRSTPKGAIETPIENPASASEATGSYIELVVSASKSLIDKSRAEIVELALKEVREFFPAARDATLLKSTVIKEVYATYSPRPGIDAFRPQQTTAWPRVFLAGDWTATGWPATMEGAVRSGYLAAEALASSAGKRPHFLTPDLLPTGIMRFFG